MICAEVDMKCLQNIPEGCMQIAIHGWLVFIFIHRRPALQVCYILLLKLDNLQMHNQLEALLTALLWCWRAWRYVILCAPAILASLSIHGMHARLCDGLGRLSAVALVNYNNTACSHRTDDGHVPFRAHCCGFPGEPSPASPLTALHSALPPANTHPMSSHAIRTLAQKLPTLLSKSGGQIIQKCLQLQLSLWIQC